MRCPSGRGCRVGYEIQTQLQSQSSQVDYHGIAWQPQMKRREGKSKKQAQAGNSMRHLPDIRRGVTDRRTDRRTDRPSYRDSMTRLKRITKILRIQGKIYLFKKSECFEQVIYIEKKRLKLVIAVSLCNFTRLPLFRRVAKVGWLK